MSRGARWGRWALMMLAVLLPVALAAQACAHLGQLALEGVQVVLKMAVIP